MYNYELTITREAASRGNGAEIMSTLRYPVPLPFSRGSSRAQKEAKRLHRDPPTTAQKAFRISV